MNLRLAIGDWRFDRGVVRAGLAAVLVALFTGGCASSRERCPANPRTFHFQTDTFAYPNDLLWEYRFATNGEWTAHKRLPEPDYALHCFVVARSAERFFVNARFNPFVPATGPETYRRLIRQALHGDAAVTIPGYADLREFSQKQEALLKEECGGAWRSYAQRGNWRMIFPFSRSHQARIAGQLVAELKENRLPIVHLARFPKLTINHAMLLFAGEETEREIRFSAYDPNDCTAPTTLTFDRTNRTFSLPRNRYFGGGQVDVYQVYHRWNY